MTIIQSLDAGLTDLARELRVRGETEGVVFGDWHFQVGTDGFDPLNPDQVTPVDYTLQSLSAPLGGDRYLGRVLSSGAAASVTVLSDGLVQIDGLSGVPESITNKWVRISGSANANLNGTWIVSERVSATSVLAYNPLADADDLGPLNWELRESCILRPNPRATDFHGRLLAPDATADGQQLGQIGVFCRVLQAPSDPSLIGTTVLFCVAHYPALGKFAEATINYHVCVQV